MTIPQDSNQRWSLDFVSDRLDVPTDRSAGGHPGRADEVLDII
jgi:hypothetical protein